MGSENVLFVSRPYKSLSYNGILTRRRYDDAAHEKGYIIRRVQPILCDGNCFSNRLYTQSRFHPQVSLRTY